MPACASSSICIREVTESDIPAIQKIYAHHVEHGVATFEMVPPSQQEMLSRFEQIRAAGMPYLAAWCDMELIGYCYANTYRARPAYRFTVEDSIYLAPGSQGRGVGTALLEALITHCAAGPWRQMIAVISGEGSEASVALHQKLGFVVSGTLRTVGYKHERWIDTIMMQRALGPGCDTPPPPTPANS